MAIPGHSTKLEYSTSPETWVEIENVEEVTPGAISIDDIETSHMQSTDQYKTFMPGWKDAGEATATVQYDETQHAALMARIGVSGGFRVTLQDGSTITFDGYIKGVAVTVEREGKVLTELTIKASGKPTFAAAA